MYLSIIRTSSEEYNTFPHDTGTIYICSDSNKVYLDRDDYYRIEITKSTVLCETKLEFENLLSYRHNMLYIVINSSEFYIGSENDEYQRVYMYKELVNKVIQDPKTLIPKSLKQNGISISPRTSTNAVFNKDGINMAETFENMRNDVRHLNKTYEKTVVCQQQDQTIFTLPYPTYNYDVSVDNLFVLVDDVYIDPSQYDINDTKIIFKNGISYDSKIKFIFHYHVVQNLNDVPNKSVGFESLKEDLFESIVNGKEISDIEFADGSTLKEKIDELITSIKGIDNNSGMAKNINDILNLVSELKISYTSDIETVKTFIQEYNTKLDSIIEISNKILTKIDSKENISSAVKRIQRGCSQIEINSENTEIILEHEIDPDKVSVNITGDSYYNETPYVYDVLKDRIIIRQKSPTINPDYRSFFSWEVIEYY